MPKTYSIFVKEEWAAKLNNGMSIEQIATKAGCDTRTVTRGIEEIWSRRAAKEALTQLYKDALFDHMKKLNKNLDMIIDDLRLPEPYMTEIAWTHVNTAEGISNAEVDNKKVLSKIDDKLSDNALLADHLRNSKPWRAFTDWSRMLQKHRNACGKLQEKTLSAIVETTGLKANSKKDKNTIPFLHVENTGDLLCRTVIKQLSGNENTPDSEQELNVEGEHGEIRHHTTVLVEGIKEAGELESCKENLVKSLEILKNSREVQQVLDIYTQLQIILPKVKTELRTVRLMGVIPGHCRACRQFGL